MIKENKIDICCMQEIDIKKNYNEDLLSISGYSLLTEKNILKSRSGIYIKSSIKFIRRADLEGVDNSLAIIDIELSRKYRLINLYRVFNPQNGISQKNYFISLW